MDERKKNVLKRIIISFIGIIICIMLILYAFIFLIYGTSCGHFAEHGTLSAKEYCEKYSCDMPDSVISIDYYIQNDGWTRAYMRIKMRRIGEEADILKQLQQINGGKLAYINQGKSEHLLPGECPEQWWNTEIITTSECYTVDDEDKVYNNGRFWIDKKGDYIYMYVSN